MAKKMIGLVMSSMDSETTLALYAGIKNKAQEFNFSTQGYVIYPSQRSSEAYNEGEFFMFETIDYKMYDGLIVALDTISSESTKKLLLDNIQKANVPTITLDCDIENGFKISTSNFESVKKIIYHLIDMHNRKKINYISGPASNEESNQRLAAYKHAMEERKLSYENRIFEGTFYVEDGKHAMDYFFNNDNARDFDAIVCGNDMQAISVIAELKSRGIKVPEEVSVTGFDDVSDCVHLKPSLTTITKDNYEVGRHAVQMLKDYWEGKSLPNVTRAGTKMIVRESCGCCGDAAISDIAKEDFLKNFQFTKLFQVYNRTFMESSTECNTFQEYIEVIKDFIRSINPEQFSLHIHQEYAKLFELEEYPAINMVGADGTTASMINVLLYTNGQFVPLEFFNMMAQADFNHKEAKKQFELMPAMQFLNSPLHYMEKKIGFIAFGNSDFPTMPSLYFSWVNSMNITINNIYNKMLLTDLYRTDSLTGLYNRFGLEYYWKKYVKISENERCSVSVIFSDMNDLKLINDKYGHEEGDFAIALIAKALHNVEDKRTKAFRYGGDEFIILAVSASEEQTQALISRIHGELEELIKDSNKEYSITASIGYYNKIAASNKSLEQCIEAADRTMYIEKQQYHNK